jgi:hypothetical protein
MIAFDAAFAGERVGWCPGICSTLTILSRSEHAIPHNSMGQCWSSPMTLTSAPVKGGVRQTVSQPVVVLM